MDISRIDLNLLVVFEALLEHQSVTRAGAAIGLSQPAMSAALARVRALFDDPLFVRAAGGVRPTARAEALAEPVRRVLQAVRSEVLAKAHFDPRATSRSFTLITPDIGEIAFLPRLLARLAAEAPNATIRTLAMPPPAIERALESGRADLAVGLFPDLTRARFYQRRLFRNSFICAVAANHHSLAEPVSLKLFLEASHAVVSPEGRSHDLFERELRRRNCVRRVRLEIPHYLSLPAIIAASDLVATVPRDIGFAFAKLAKLRLLEPPFNVSFDVRQYWHERAHKDPVNVWLRKMIHELFHD
ncbi:MAG: LysR family transcriptional regulator [Burkholderiales bacterium]|nr:LysR family transcriptional regulator [Burkholderiales bacterium]